MEGTTKGQHGLKRAETFLSGLGPSWTNSCLAGLTKAADHVEKTSGRLCIVCQPILVSCAAAETHLCLVGWGKGLGRRQRSFRACPSFSCTLSPCPACCWPKAGRVLARSRLAPSPPGWALSLSAPECLLAFLQRQGWAKLHWAAPAGHLPGPPGDSQLLQVLGRHIRCAHGPGRTAEKAKAAGGESACAETCPSYLACACRTCLFYQTFVVKNSKEFWVEDETEHKSSQLEFGLEKSLPYCFKSEKNLRETLSLTVGIWGNIYIYHFSRMKNCMFIFMPCT